ncbi:MAG: molybdenum cofactor guanylyltransferase [Myxococcus sp.]|nr:molybdenum cofactor guanylyltransferase [Myxococcus sp.]
MGESRAVALTIAVIAGGVGKRLGGRVKGLLELDGAPLISRLFALATDGDEVLVVTNTPEAFARFGHAMVGDLVPGKGAPGGVVTALVTATTDWVLVVASDMPFLERAHVAALLAQAVDGVEVVVATRAGALEPLCALYRRSLAAQWRDALDDDPSLRGLIAGVPHVRVALPPRALDSLNTPEDLARHGVR